jgi:hypothetical protein
VSVRRSLSLIATIALAGVVAGCSDDSGTTTTTPVTTTTPEAVTLPKHDLGSKGAGEVGPYPSADEQQTAIEETIGAVLLVADPDDACSRLVTERYVRQAYGDEAGCRRAQTDAAKATDIRFNPIAYRRGNASTIIDVSGGALDGQTPTVRLVLDGSTWKIDSIASSLPPGP